MSYVLSCGVSAAVMPIGLAGGGNRFGGVRYIIRRVTGYI